MEITRGLLYPLRVTAQELGTVIMEQYPARDPTGSYCFPGLELASESPPGGAGETYTASLLIQVCWMDLERSGMDSPEQLKFRARRDSTKPTLCLEDLD